MVSRMTHRTLATVKADAARNAFGAFGDDIVWAVLDSGIEASHPHFRAHRNLELPAPLRHCDFTTFGELSEDESERAALIDEAGHGTHVAGIIAGALREGPNKRNDEDIQVSIKATVNRKDERGEVIHDHLEIKAISGMAATCKLISFKVLDKHGKGPVEQPHRRARADPGDQRQRPLHPDPRRQHERRLRLRARAGSPAARARCASRSTGWCAPAWWSSSRPAIPATAGTSGVQRRGRRRHGSHDQRSGQRRARDHGRVHPSRHAARLRRLVLLVQGTDRRRPPQAGPRGARREDHLLPVGGSGDAAGGDSVGAARPT